MPFMHVFIICYLWTLGNVLMNNASRKTIILFELGTCANFCVKALVAERKLHLFGDCFCQKILKIYFSKNKIRPILKTQEKDFHFD